MHERIRIERDEKGRVSRVLSQIETNNPTDVTSRFYPATTPNIKFPTVDLYNRSGLCHGFFGDYVFHDLNKYAKDIQYMTNNQPYYCSTPISFGPYINLELLRDSVFYRLDDCFVQYKPDTKYITIWDHNIINNNPHQINWLKRQDIPKPIIFEPKIRLNCVPKKVENPKDNPKTEQSSTENMVFRLIEELGFDKYYTSERFFRFVPGNNEKTNFDSGVLFKSGHDSFKYIFIDSTNMTFILVHIYKGYFLYQKPLNFTQLSNALQQVKNNRDTYMIKTYGTKQSR